MTYRCDVLDVVVWAELRGGRLAKALVPRSIFRDAVLLETRLQAQERVVSPHPQLNDVLNVSTWVRKSIRTICVAPAIAKWRELVCGVDVGW